VAMIIDIAKLLCMEYCDHMLTVQPVKEFAKATISLIIREQAHAELSVVLT